MTLNGTLFVQMINFALVYVVLDRLVFRRALASIVHEDTEYAHMRADLAAVMAQQYDLERERVSAWQEFGKQFKAEAPEIIVPVHTVLHRHAIRTTVTIEVQPSVVPHVAEVLSNLILTRKQ